MKGIGFSRSDDKFIFTIEAPLRREALLDNLSVRRWLEFAASIFFGLFTVYKYFVDSNGWILTLMIFVICLEMLRSTDTKIKLIQVIAKMQQAFDD